MESYYQLVFTKFVLLLLCALHCGRIVCVCSLYLIYAYCLVWVHFVHLFESVLREHKTQNHSFQYVETPVFSVCWFSDVLVHHHQCRFQVKSVHTTCSAPGVCEAQRGAKRRVNITPNIYLVDTPPNEWLCCSLSTGCVHRQLFPW